MGRDKSIIKQNIQPSDDSPQKKHSQTPNLEGFFEDPKNSGKFYFTCSVKPNAHENRILHEKEGWVINITAPPVKGKANSDIIKFIGQKIGIPKSKILLIKGETSHQKMFYIDAQGLSLIELKERLRLS